MYENVPLKNKKTTIWGSFPPAKDTKMYKKTYTKYF